MCDYSLHGVASRPAKVGDKLLTTQFWNTSTRGFTAVEESRVAVCLLPGTEVVFEREVERHLTGFHLFLKRTKALPHQVARFRQVNMDNPCTHHDALEFSDGQIVLLTHLRAGQRATVLQLPAQPKPADLTTDVLTVGGWCRECGCAVKALIAAVPACPVISKVADSVAHR